MWEADPIPEPQQSKGIQDDDRRGRNSGEKLATVDETEHERGDLPEYVISFHHLCKGSCKGSLAMVAIAE